MHLSWHCLSFEDPRLSSSSKDSSWMIILQSESWVSFVLTFIQFQEGKRIIHSGCISKG